MTAQDRAGARGEAPTTGAADSEVLAEQLGQLARLLQGERDTKVMLDQLVGAAVRTIPGAQEASLSLVTGRRYVVSEHPTSELPRLVDEVQNETGEGPCLDAIYEQRTVRVPDLRHEQRWPRFARRAYELGAGSMLSLQLFVEGDNLGALNLFSREADAFSRASEQVGLLFASHAAVAFADAHKLDQLALAVSGRDLIGQAKGMLMERYKIDDGRAFMLLTRISQQTHRKLREVAQELVTTGRLPGVGEPAGGPTPAAAARSRRSATEPGQRSGPA